MDIAITLPRQLWHEIESGRKIVECRKSTPTHIKMGKTRCWVIMKGTPLVLGYFIIESVTPRLRVHDVVKNHLKDICVSKEWLEIYAQECKYLSLWHIGKVRRLPKMLNAKLVLGIEHNPQSFVYCNCKIEYFNKENGTCNW